MKEFNEYYDILLAACRSEDVLLAAAYRRLRELLEHLCRTQMTDSSLQMTDLSARCLLYTSPSPRDRHKSRMPSSA